jgi:hypothetical protein
MRLCRKRWAAFERRLNGRGLHCGEPRQGAASRLRIGFGAPSKNGAMGVHHWPVGGVG